MAIKSTVIYNKVKLLYMIIIINLYFIGISNIIVLKQFVIMI
jgi:hypothetical protein